MQIIYLTSGIAIIHVNSISIINVMIANLVLKKKSQESLLDKKRQLSLASIGRLFLFPTIIV